MPHSDALMPMPTERAYTAPTFQNAWSNYGGGYNDAGYFRDALGFVHLRGMIKNAAINSTAFTLPAGYRPVARNIFLVMGGTFTPAVVYINATGEVVPFSGDPAFVSLDVIHFQAAQ